MFQFPFFRSVTTSSTNLKLAVPKEKKRGLLRRLSGGKSKVTSKVYFLNYFFFLHNSYEYFLKHRLCASYENVFL